MKRPILETVPQSISNIEYDRKLTTYLNFLFASKRIKRKIAERKPAAIAAAAAATTEKTSSEHQPADEDEDEDRMEEDQEIIEDEKDLQQSNISAGSEKRRNPDAGYTVIIRFQESVPDSHPLGKYPPRWVGKRDKKGELFRGLKFIDLLTEIFALVPGKHHFFSILIKE
jgi:ribosomal protein L12E/L44/L45/RPP1/RPP2